MRISRIASSKRGTSTPRRCLLQLVDSKHSKLRKSKRRSFMRRLSKSLRQSMRMISDSRKRLTGKRWSISKLRLMNKRRTTKSLLRGTSLQSSKSLRIERLKSSRLRIRIQRTSTKSKIWLLNPQLSCLSVSTKCQRSTTRLKALTVKSMSRMKTSRRNKSKSEIWRHRSKSLKMISEMRMSRLLREKITFRN